MNAIKRNGVLLSALAVVIFHSLALASNDSGHDSVQSIQSNEVCVLNMERRLHPFSIATLQIFGDQKGVKLITEAKPLDFFNHRIYGAQLRL